MSYKTNFQKVDQHTGGKWLFRGTNHRKTISCIAWNVPVQYPSWEYAPDIEETNCNMFNQIF